jgi:transcriptional regulator with XRE-family HTH domain
VLVIERNVNHLTQYDIADRLQCPRSYVSRMEGKGWMFPTAKSVPRIAEAYGTTLGKLVVMIEWLMEGE